MAEALLPPLGGRVHLTVLATGVEHTAVVDDVTPTGEILLREPVGASWAVAARLGEDARLRVTWTSARGRHELDARFRELTAGVARRWRLVADSGATTVQLRRFARSGDALRVSVRRGGTTWEAVVADLGEGGARLVVVETRDAEVGDLVVLQTEVDGELLDLSARVLEVTDLDAERSQLRLEFDEIGRAADILRRRVLALQRRSRALQS